MTPENTQDDDDHPKIYELWDDIVFLIIFAILAILNLLVLKLPQAREFFTAVTIIFMQLSTCCKYKNLTYSSHWPHDL